MTAEPETWELQLFWKGLPYLHFSPENLLRIIRIEIRDALECLSKSGLAR